MFSRQRAAVPLAMVFFLVSSHSFCYPFFFFPSFWTARFSRSTGDGPRLGNLQVPRIAPCEGVFLRQPRYSLSAFSFSRRAIAFIGILGFCHFRVKLLYVRRAANVFLHRALTQETHLVLSASPYFIDFQVTFFSSGYAVRNP